LNWCKERALEYAKEGDTQNAFASFMSDMSKHDETKDHSALKMMPMMLFGGMLSTPEQMSKFIEGFN
jgi:hypothetical protein